MTSCAIRIVSARTSLTMLVVAGPDADPGARTVRPVFFFPDGRIVLERVDSILASSKSLGSVWLTHGYHHTDFSNTKLAETMVNGNLAGAGPACPDLVCYLRENSQSHGLVGFVLKKRHSPTGCVVTHGPEHENHGSLPGCLGAFKYRLDINRAQSKGKITVIASLRKHAIHH